MKINIFQLVLLVIAALALGFAIGVTYERQQNTPIHQIENLLK